jgi:hypothetical protein
MTKKRKTMEELAEGYKVYIKNKKPNPKGSELFEKTLKKAAKGTTKRTGK